MTLLLRVLCLGAAMVYSVATATAETRAVLVGVSDYDDASGITDLRGPANDVRLLLNVLRQRDVSDITILADGVTDSVVPTRTAILNALDQLVERTSKDDFIYIHLSGHGSRQVDTSGDETDGLDEVFLPADTAKASSGNASIPNAIIDDEIGAYVAQLRSKGANVWLVIDACHAGSGIRSSDPRIAARFVDPETLGIPVTSGVQSGETVFDSDYDEGGGGYLAFYAARSYELAHEVNMAAEGEAAAWYGLFTSKLAVRLQSSQASSFRQVFQGVLSDVNGSTVPGAARIQTPSWEGTLIDAVVFGGAATEGVRRFAVEGDAIEAGLLHGVPEGTLVGLVADAAAPPDQVIGFAQTEEASATQSFLRPVTSDCVPLSDEPCALSGSLPSGAKFAQVMARPLDRETTLAVPTDLDGDPLPEDHPARVALSEAVAAVNADGAHAVVLSKSEFAVDVIWDGTSLWFGQSVLQGQTPVGLKWTPNTTDLSDLMVRIARAEVLAAMLTAVGQGRSILSPNPIDVISRYSPVDVNDLASLNAPEPARRECTRAYRNFNADDARALEPRAQLKQCDQLEFSAIGQKPGYWDVNRVYIDSQFCVTTHHERIEGMSAPRQLGPAMTLCSDCPGGVSTGAERLFMITTEGRENVESLNLVGLLENCDARGGTRSAASEVAISFLERLARRPDTRGVIGGFGISNVWVEPFSWQVLPRREVFLRAGRSLAD